MKSIELLKDGEKAIVKKVVDESLTLCNLGLTPNVNITKLHKNVYRFRSGTFYIRPGNHKIFIKDEK